MVSSDLSWSKHVHVTVNKACKILGLVYKTLGSSNPEAFPTSHKSLVRPVLEYKALAWSPYLYKDIQTLEKETRRILFDC